MKLGSKKKLLTRKMEKDEYLFRSLLPYSLFKNKILEQHYFLFSL